MPVTDVAVDPKGTLMATASADGTVRISQVADGKFVRALVGHKGAVNAVSFSNTGTHIATGGADGTARLWTVADGKQTAIFEHGSVVSAVLAVGVGTQVISGGTDKFVRQWDPVAKPDEETKKVKPLREISGHTAAIISLALTGTTLASGSADKTVKLWNSATGAAVRTITSSRCCVEHRVFTERYTNRSYRCRPRCKDIHGRKWICCGDT